MEIIMWFIIGYIVCLVNLLFYWWGKDIKSFNLKSVFNGKEKQGGGIKMRSAVELREEKSEHRGEINKVREVIEKL